MYSQTMAARFDCKKLLRFALATLCLLALALLLPVAVNAADASIKSDNETVDLTISDGGAEGAASVFFKRKGSADEDKTNTGHVWLEVYVLQDNGSLQQLGTKKEFKYQYNSHIDRDLYTNYNETTNSFNPSLSAEDPNNKKHGAGVGGYASLDLGVNVSEGYTLYKVDYTVCYSSEGPKKTGWKDNADFTGDSVKGPTQYYYLDNITDGTLVKVYIMPTYTIKYEVKYGENVIDVANYGTYFTISSGNLANVTGYPQNGEASVGSCAKLTDMTTGMTKENFTENEGNDPAGTPRYTPKIYPYHRWCTEDNEKKAVDFAKAAFDYSTTTSVTLPTLTANSGYQVTGWSISGDTSDNTYNGGKPMSVADLARIANNRVITLTAVVTDQVPPSTDDSGNGGTTGGDSGDSGDGGDGGTSGGQESTPTPTPASTPSVTTVTAVAPTATPTATPAPTAEPTATPAPAAVSAHIPQTSDDMPYTLLVVTALASLCAAGAMFKKRRSK